MTQLETVARFQVCVGVPIRSPDDDAPHQKADLLDDEDSGTQLV